MAATDFASMNSEQKLVWSRRVWSAARDKMFIKKFLGEDENNCIQHVKQLTKTEKGTRCLMQLVADLVEDGQTGDGEREGHEEAMATYEQEIDVDIINHGIKEKGKLAEQKTVINTRKQARNKLAYWLANRCDQLAFLTMAGISYAFNNDGSTRVGSNLTNLEFASAVSAPTSNRGLMWNGTALVASNTASVTSGYTASYDMIVDLCAYAKDHYVKPLMADGKEYYILFVKPGTLAQLKKDEDYQRAVVTAAPRSKENPWFTGGTVTIDGAVIHEHRLVYNTKGAAAGSKWGAGGNVDGTRTMLCGAQALGMADIGSPAWVEKLFQYDSVWGINVDKMFGLLKPKFYSIYDEAVEDFGIVTVDHYLQ